MAVQKINRNNGGGNGGSSLTIKTMTLNIDNPTLTYYASIIDAESTTTSKIIIFPFGQSDTFENTGEEPLNTFVVPKTGSIDVTICSQYPTNKIKGQFKFNYIIQ